MGKRKLSELEESVCEGEDKSATYEEKLLHVSCIAEPMASRKLAKKLYKLIKKSSKEKTYLRHGLKDVQASLRKGETGIMVLAGNVTPVDIMCHLPGVCEEKGIPYVYVPSRQDIGVAMGVKRSCLATLVKEHDSYKDLYEDCRTKIKDIPARM